MKIIRGQELPFVPASHENPNSPGVLKKVLATRDDLMQGRVQMVNWSQLPAGSEFQSHFHEDMLEVFIMLNGRVKMWVDGEAFELNGGDAILIDPQEVHQMKNLTDANVEYVVFGISSEQGGKTVVVENGN